MRVTPIIKFIVTAYFSPQLHGTGSTVDNFDHWLTVYGGMLPSNHRRWCTKMLKLKPFEAYVGNDPVINYVALRGDHWGRMAIVDTKPFKLRVILHRIFVERPQVTGIPAWPGGAACYRRSRYIL